MTVSDLRASTAWKATERTELENQIVWFVVDVARTRVYALDRANSYLLIASLNEHRVIKKVYVGKDPSDADIDPSGKLLYIANKGPGTGAPGSNRIGVVDLETLEPVASWILPSAIENLSAGREGRLYYNSGFDASYGLAYSVDSQNGNVLEHIGYIKTRMVISRDKLRLYGQRIYDGNLGEMGVFNVSADPVSLIGQLGYPGYGNSYGWGWPYFNNYSLSGNDKLLGFGSVIFNATNLVDQIGLLPEHVFALNYDGSIAFGEFGIWNTLTFKEHGDPARIGDMPFPSRIMRFSVEDNTLYAFNPLDRSIHRVEEVTPGGVPLRWLRTHGLSSTNGVELSDPDNDGLNVLQEWIMNSDPNAASEPLRIRLSGRDLVAERTSPGRSYTIEQSEDLRSGWTRIAQRQGTGTNLVEAIPQSSASSGFFRVKVSLF